MHITPDHIVLWRWGLFHLNATIVYTWVLIILLTRCPRGCSHTTSPDPIDRARAGRTPSK